MKKYITTQQDTWDVISLKNYGNEFFVQELIKANRDYRNILVFDANIELNIPEIEKPKSEYLAPWKR